MRMMNTKVAHWLGTALLALVLPLQAAERFTFQHERILGTSLEIQIDAVDQAVAEQAEARVLAEIDRLAKVFSSYDADSEFSRWQRTKGVPTAVSSELLHVLAASDRYRELSHGAFQPAVQLLTDLWKQSEKLDRRPTAEELQDAVARLRQPQWSLETKTRQATRLASGPLTLNAIAKGTIIDAAARAGLAAAQPGTVEGVIVCIGGDLRVAGTAVQPIQIVDPFNDAENAPTVATIFVHDQAVATSGNYRRGFTIGGRRLSHIFDPRTGQPAERIASATVVAPTAEEADALATIFSILTPAESARLAASLEQVQYLLIDVEGTRHQSPGWDELTEPRLFRLADKAREELALVDAKQAKDEPPADPAKPAAAGNLLELVVKFELDKPAGAQYRRPYVAVWLEDEDEFPVRTALLFMQTKQPGPRWHRDLLRWWRHDRVRKLADGKDLIGTVSGATRGPGEYKAVFDGKDDAGQPLPAGNYTLFIEVAREHGTYQLIKQPLKLGADAIVESQLKGNVEVKTASYEYRQPTPAPAKPAGE